MRANVLQLSVLTSQCVLLFSMHYVLLTLQLITVFKELDHYPSCVIKLTDSKTADKPPHVRVEHFSSSLYLIQQHFDNTAQVIDASVFTHDALVGIIAACACLCTSIERSTDCAVTAAVFACLHLTVHALKEEAPNTSTTAIRSGNVFTHAEKTACT
jgi:hypothetical protein